MNQATQNMAPGETLLCVENLSVEMEYLKTQLRLLDALSFEVKSGQTHALIGESGAGKTMTLLAILGLLPPKAKIRQGQIYFQNHRIEQRGEWSFAGLRGKKIAVVFQNAGAALNPLFTVGRQMADVMKTHLKISAAHLKDEIIALLQQVELKNPREVFRAYPHQLSGGMAQRVMLAMALSCRPELIIADEPTTALDVTTKMHILKLIQKLQAERGFALLLISHDLSVVATLANSVSILKNGRIVESGEFLFVFNNPQHAYSRQLIGNVLPEI